MALVAHAGLWLTRQTQPRLYADPFSKQLSPAAPGLALPFGTDGLVQAMASGEMRLAACSNVQLYASLSNVLIGAQGSSNVISVGSNTVTIQGNLRVVGSVDTVSSTELRLVDKIVHVAVPTEGVAAIKDVDLDASGLMVTSATAVMGQAKSVLWRLGGATTGDPTVTPAAWLASYQAPRWELRGGGLRITVPSRSNTAQAAAGGELMCAITFNSNEDVEMTRLWTNASGASAKAQRVLAFGYSAPGGAKPTLAQLLPTSANPYAP